MWVYNNWMCRLTIFIWWQHSKIGDVEHCGQDESEFTSTTLSPVPRAKADVLGGGVVVSQVLFFDP